MTLAALEAVLALYRDPDRLAERLPTLRLLARPANEIRARRRTRACRGSGSARRHRAVSVAPCASQIGSGALPVERLPSAAIVVRRDEDRPGCRYGAERYRSGALRALPVPVIGRIADGALWLDLRCLEDEAAFVNQLTALRL